MLTHLRLKLDLKEKGLSYQSSYLFQGVLMEIIDTNIAEILHNLPYNPYSQWLEINRDIGYWNIYGLNEFAYENIIKPILDIEYIYLENKNAKIDIKDINLSKKPRGKLIEENLFGENSRNIDIKFKSPTSFKRDNRYVIFPDSRLIFQNLMKKFDATGEETVFSYELLEDMSKDIYISRYRMKSSVFHMKKIRVPSFIGDLRLRLNGRKEIVNLASFLTRFGEYSGVGIKPSIGMGSMEIGGGKNG